MKKYDKGEIAEIILSTLLVAGVITVAAVATNAVQIYKYFTPKNSSDRMRIKRSVTRLERTGFIEHAPGGKGLFVLTKKGKEKALRYSLEQMKIAPQKTWDKKWRFVMFDVPEEKKQARRAINLVLKKIGCVQYQKSVFVTPFPCKKEIDFVGESFGVRDNIRIIVASEVEQIEPLKKAFKV